MNCTTRRPVRTKNVYVPHFGNIVNEIFNTPVSQVVRSGRNNTSTPAVNVIKTDDDYTLELAVPGHAKGDIKITLENDVLTIASTKEKTLAEGTEFRLREFNYNGFERAFIIPDTVNQEKVEAAFKNGVLTLTLTKKEEAKPQPAKTIKIK